MLALQIQVFLFFPLSSYSLSPLSLNLNFLSLSFPDMAPTAPTRTQSYLLGSASSSGQNRPSKSNASTHSRSHIGHPYIRPPSGETSTDVVLGTLPSLFQILQNVGMVLVNFTLATSSMQGTLHGYQSETDMNNPSA
ncbi:hypothetical protein BJ165DRAFT_227021 [Panaeolus papilionaceus]|nr:hypothetical protein BJ165DRAFT_227021 [Panaeolus papilionaceus]